MKSDMSFHPSPNNVCCISITCCHAETCHAEHPSVTDRNNNLNHFQNVFQQLSTANLVSKFMLFQSISSVSVILFLQTLSFETFLSLYQVFPVEKVQIKQYYALHEIRGI